VDAGAGIRGTESNRVESARWRGGPTLSRNQTHPTNSSQADTQGPTERARRSFGCSQVMTQPDRRTWWGPGRPGSGGPPWRPGGPAARTQPCARQARRARSPPRGHPRRRGRNCCAGRQGATRAPRCRRRRRGAAGALRRRGGARGKVLPPGARPGATAAGTVTRMTAGRPAAAGQRMLPLRRPAPRPLQGPRAPHRVLALGWVRLECRTAGGSCDVVAMLGARLLRDDMLTPEP
jgi:hypothetical protein